MNHKLLNILIMAFCLTLGLPAAFGQAPTPGDPGTCFVIADEGNTPNAPGNGNATADTLYVIDRLTGLATLIGTTGTFEAEALTFDVINQVLYTMEGGTLTSLDFANSGAATTIGPAGSGTAGGVTVLFDDLDGLEFDYSTSPPTLYATQRVDSPAADLLVQIDPATGAIVPGAFPGGADYVAIGTTATEDNIDDIAIDCQTGIMYGILNNGDNGTVDQLVTIDKVTGAIANVAATGIFDMEGLAFGGDGVLFGSTGNNGDAPTTANSTYDLGTPGEPGFGTAANGIRVIDDAGTDIGFDFEGLACFIEEPALQISLGLVSGSSECDCNAQAQIIITAGGVTLSGITIANDQLPGCDQVIPTLLPGQTFTITCPLSSTIVNTTTASGTDCYNRTANASETETITPLGDSTPPSFVGVPSTIDIACGDPLPTDLPTLADDCANPDQIGLGVVTTLVCPDEITRVWTATDICGNTSSASQTIMITDYALTLSGVPANAELSCEDPIPGAQVSLAQNCSSIGLATPGTTVETLDVVITNTTQSSVCYAITDEGLTGGAGSGATIDDALFLIDPVTGIATSLGNTGTLDVEAMAIEPDNGTIYAFDGGTLVIIDPANVGTPTTVGAAGTTANGALGVAVTFDDLDGAAFDQTTTPATLYATQREAGNDLLVQIDPATGALVPGAFGGDDYVVIGSLGTLVNVDDIAIDPNTGILYGIFNDADNTTADELAIIDTTTGAVTDADPADNIGIFDVEGLDFDCDGILRGTTGNNGDAPTTANSALTLGIPGQAGFGAAANINPVVDAGGATIGFDFEAFSCFCEVVETIETVTITTTNTVILDFVNDLNLTLAATTNVSVDGCQTTIERVWTGTDACNNSASATQTIIIVDDVPPTLSGVPADATAECDNIPAAPTVTAADTCSNVDIDLVTTNIPGPICANEYTLQRVWTATDACGNTISATQNVAVTDNTPPTINATPQSLPGDANCEAMLPAIAFVASDNCSEAANVTVTQSPAAGTLVSGMINVTITAEDECGNTNATVVAVDVSCAAPAINLAKTVYVGHDGGVSCPGSEVVTAAPSVQITYCFEVNNPGPVALTNVVVNDATIAMPAITIGDMAVGQTITVFYETTSSGALTNTADVTGSGPDGTPVDDDDSAEVIEPGVPGIMIVKTAGTAADGETFTIGAAGDVLYTFDVTNTGDTFLSNITITDDAGTPGDTSDDVTLTSADCAGLAGPLAPLGTVQCTLTLAVADDTVNTASTTGNPTDPDGNDIPGVPDPIDEDPADVVLAEPGIMIVKTAGTAADGETFTIGAAGDVLYTFDVTNTGDTFLSNITITDDAGTPGDTSDDVTLTSADCADLAGPLAPLGTVQCTLTLMVSEDTVNNASTTGNPTDPDGNDLPGVPDPTDADPADVEVVPELVSIGSTVFLDPNDNGVQDAGEAGIAGVLVEVLDAAGNVVGSDTTDGAGDYFVDMLAEGTYTVRITTPPAAAPTSSTPSATGDDQVDGDDNGDQPGGSGTVVTSGAITLTADGEPTGEPGQGGAQDAADDDNGDMTIDFGFVPEPELVSIGSTVFLDPNDNGVQDAGEAGIAGVLVEVLDAAGNVVGSDTTDGAGDYFVDMLAEGTYTVRITTPPAAAPTSSTPSATGDDQVDGDDNGDQPGGSGTVVTSGAITLTADGEPTGEPEQGGAQDAADDNNGDMTIDFGFVPEPELVSIGSTVFLDPNDNGIQDAGEAGIAGVLVEVLDAAGTVVGSDTTDGAGDYFVDMLAEGTYTVRITTPPAAAPTSSTPSATGDDQVDGDDNGDQPGGSGTVVTSGAITLTADGEPTGEPEQGGGQDAADDDNGDMTIDFGFVPEPELVSIGSTVFLDPNDNGIQDAGEAGIAGVLVEVLDAAGTVVGSDTTDAMGDYFVDMLAEGTYTVRITTPPAAAPTSSTPSATGDDQVDGDDNGDQPGGAGTPVTSGAITLTADGEPTGEPEQGGAQDAADDDNGDMTIDFGFVPEPELVSIGSTVFLDPNDNGIQDVGEAGIAGVLVEVLDAAGTVVGSDTTDAMGDYFVDMLAEGTYTVRITTPPAAAPTSSTPSATGDDQVDGDDNGDQPGGAGTPVTSVPITLTADGEPSGEPGQGGAQDAADDDNGDMTIDFGFVPPGDVSIGSTVFLDPNDNGIQDAGEMGIPGVLVEVLDGSGAVVGSDTTDGMGDYFIGGLDEGAYTVRITTPPATAPTSSTPSATGDDQVDGDDNGDQPGGAGTPVNSGVITLTDNGEPTGEPEQGGGQDAADDDNGDMTIDFGFVPDVAPEEVSIGSTVFLDPNDNGIQDAGEAGIPGVLVEVLDGSGAVVGSDTTDSMGDYFISGLDEGTYTVRITTPPASAPTSSTPSATGDDQVDGDDNGDQPGGSGTPVTSGMITLTADGEPTGETEQGGNQDVVDDNNGDMTIDFGFVPPPPEDPVSIGSTVFLDPNDNGIQDAGEMGIPGVLVEVLDGSGAVVGSDTTDGAGDYFIGELDEGTYTVRITTPPATAPTSSTPTATGDDDVDTDDNGDQPGGAGTPVTSGMITLTDNGEPTGEPGQGGGQDSADDDNGNMTIDFGFVPPPPDTPVSIGSTVFLDPNDNGIQDAGEMGIPGVLVEVLDGSGAVVGSDTTDGAGDYFIGELDEGTYTVRITTPPATAPTSSTPTATGDDDVDTDDNGDQPGGAGTPVTSGMITLTNNGEPTGEPGQGGGQDSADDDNGNMTVDFGFVPPPPDSTVSIGSTVFLDPNDNGMQDAGEAGIPGVLVEVLDGSGAVVGSDTTDAMGDYFIADLDEGDYTVRITTPPASSPTSSTTSNLGDDDVDSDDNGEQPGGAGTPITSGIITLMADTEPTGEPGQGGTQDVADDNNGNMTIDFGLVPLGSIAGNVGEDTDDDDAPNTPIAGVVIQLFDGAGTLLDTTVTDSAGNYLFPDLPAGDYLVVETQPAGLLDVTEGDTAPDATDSTMAPDTVLDNELPVTLAAGEDDVGNDFVEEQPAQLGSIAGNVGEDTDDDDAPNTPIAGVVVQLFDTAGNLLDTTVTDGAGNYLFPDLPAGDYLVVETQPAGLLDVTEGDTAPDATDSTMAPDTVLDNELPVTLAAGEDDVGNDFVEEQPPLLGSIAGNVGEDTDDDDAPNTPIGGVTVQLFDGAGNLLDTTVTDGAGNYLFPNLPAGDYLVVETQPAGLLDVTEGDTAPDATDSTMAPDTVLDNQLAVTLAAGEDDLGNDFVEEQPPLGSIAGNVGEDTDDDDAPNTPIAGVVVQLFDTAGNLLDTTVTDGDGNYLFPDLPAGDYLVVETQPAGLLDVTEGDTAPDATDSTMAPDTVLDNQLAVTLAAGEDDLGNDFVEEQPPLGSIAGNVGEDTDDDDAPNTPIAGVVVQLFDTAGNLLDTTVTDGDGNYLFPNLPAGNYLVIETQPAGLLDVTEGDTAPDATDSTTAPDTVLDNQLAVTIAAGEDDVGNDFVEEQPVVLGSIAGSVGEDTDNDDAPNTPIAGVTVQLFDTAGNLIATTTTDSAGNYVFPNLPAGNYLVIETQPAGLLDVTEGDTAPDATDSTTAPDTVLDNQLAVTIAAGEDDIGNDFVEEQPPTVGIGSTIFLDGNDNGIQDADEMGIPGVQIEVLNSVGAVAGTAVSDASGNWFIAGLAEGTYTVRIPTPPAVAPTSSTPSNLGDDQTDGDDNGEQPGGSGAPINSGPITLTAGAEPVGEPGPGGNQDASNDTSGDLTIDFGLVPPRAQIGDTVFMDFNNNGVPDEMLETFGLAGVTVDLYLVNPADGTETLVDTQETGPNGFYNFTDLPAGTYRTEVDRNDILPTLVIDTTPLTYTVTVVGGDIITDNDFGFIDVPSAIELETFTAEVTESGVTISWSTAWEQDSLGFFLYRVAADGSVTRVNEGLVLALGGGTEYSIEEVGATGGRYILEEIETDLNRTIQSDIAVATVDGAPVGVPTLSVQAEGGVASFATEAAYKSYLVSGLDGNPQILDVTNADNPRELSGEILGEGSAAYFSAPEGLEIQVGPRQYNQAE